MTDTFQSSTTASPLNPRVSKSLGALLGVHAGDSLGATVEFETHGRIQKQYPNGVRDIIGGGPFGWPAGHATDDTDLTRAVLLAYRDRAVAQQGSSTTINFDVVKSAADWSLKWYKGDWPDRTLGEGPVDIGGATEQGLSKYEDTRDPRYCGAGFGMAGNGSLMRCIPTALFAETREERIRDSKAISAFTHNDTRCSISCAVYNEIVAALVDGKSVLEAVECGQETAKELNSPMVEEAISTGYRMPISRYAATGPGDKLPGRTSGYVLQSLSVAIGALTDPRPLEEVLIDVVRLGGDTDTNGAIAGGLLGARDGIEAIPARWLDKLQFRSDFEEIATSLLSKS
ncbi:ADP-ribosylglycohydrolase [Periconia macrospinosa]|uniref:ADP-ribosylhydrolase ARH3 n=1 Tax=Periconia macrospinosa TaxID=97972 RepID=A0A2V1D1G0_9PLEO|nr:ADP-ribosylglycohydrolase [Periconia macrospinosa]